MPIIPALRRQGQGDQEFKVSFSYKKMFKLAWASQTKLGTKAIQVVASLGQGVLMRGQFGLYSKTVSKKTTTREGRNF